MNNNEMSTLNENRKKKTFRAKNIKEKMKTNLNVCKRGLPP